MRYFFDIHDGKIIPDDTGTVLTDIEGARDFARRMIVEMASSMSLRRDAVQLRVNVRDSAGGRVLTGTLLLLVEPTE